MYLKKYIVIISKEIMGNIFTKKAKKVANEIVHPPTPPRVSIMEPSPAVTEDSLTPQVDAHNVDEKYVSENLPSSSEVSVASAISETSAVDKIPHYVTPLIPSVIQVAPCDFPPSLESSRKPSLEEGEIFITPTLTVGSPRTSFSTQEPLEPIEECSTSKESNDLN
jgi:hypothetical protein